MKAALQSQPLFTKGNKLPSRPYRLDLAHLIPSSSTFGTSTLLLAGSTYQTLRRSYAPYSRNPSLLRRLLSSAHISATQMSVNIDDGQHRRSPAGRSQWSPSPDNLVLALFHASGHHRNLRRVTNRNLWTDRISLLRAMVPAQRASPCRLEDDVPVNNMVIPSCAAHRAMQTPTGFDNV
jgi:hypothetical protein